MSKTENLKDNYDQEGPCLSDYISNEQLKYDMTDQIIRTRIQEEYYGKSLKKPEDYNDLENWITNLVFTEIQRWTGENPEPLNF